MKILNILSNLFTLDYSENDLKILNQKNFSQNNERVIIITSPANSHHSCYYSSYIKTTEKVNFLFQRKILVPLKLEYKFFKGEIFGHPTYYKDTSSLIKATLVKTQDDAVLSESEIIKKYKAEFLSYQISLF